METIKIQDKSALENKGYRLINSLGGTNESVLVYSVYDYHGNYPVLGFSKGALITGNELHKIINEKKINVMILHSREKNGVSTCFLDTRNFKQS